MKKFMMFGVILVLIFACLSTTASKPLCDPTYTPVPTSTPIPTNTDTVVPEDTDTPVPEDTSTPVLEDTNTPIPEDSITPTSKIDPTSTPVNSTSDPRTGKTPAVKNTKVIHGDAWGTQIAINNLPETGGGMPIEQKLTYIGILVGLISVSFSILFILKKRKCI